METSTENEQVLTPFLRSLMERGLDISEGVLVIVDGGKGLRAAVKRAFGEPGPTLPMAQTRERGELPVEDRASRVA